MTARVLVLAAVGAVVGAFGPNPLLPGMVAGFLAIAAMWAWHGNFPEGNPDA